MAEDIAISCRCGEVRGTLRYVGPREGDRYTCYRSDCRDFIRLLEHESEALDANGGVSVYQTRVGKLDLSAGTARLAALHMTEKSTVRWYSSCCNTPFFNTLDRAKPPFLSVVTVCCDEMRRDAVLGPSRGDIFPEEANPPLENPTRVSGLKLAAGFLPRIIKDSLGANWRQSPLFDPETKQPIANPRRISAEERASLDAR